MARSSRVLLATILSPILATLTAGAAGLVLATIGYAIEGNAPKQTGIVILGVGWLAACGITAVISATLTLIAHWKLRRMEVSGVMSYLGAALLMTLVATVPFPLISCPLRCEYDVCSECGTIGWVTYFMAVIFAGGATGAWFWLIRRPDRDTANPPTSTS